MSPEERSQASTDLTNHYFLTAYPSWRLAKVLANYKIYLDRFDFFSEFIDIIKTPDDTNGDSTIAQELKNGLYFDTIAQCTQYIEDLFAVINAKKTPDYFIKNIVTYNAGKIGNLIKGFKILKETTAEAFQIPLDIPFTEEIKVQFDKKLDLIMDDVKEIIDFYKDFEFFYTQYKHGLAIPMRPFGRLLDEKHIQRDKESIEDNTFLVVWDNFNIAAASSKNRFNLQKNGAFFPGFTKKTIRYLSRLHEENNCLRFVFVPDNKNFKFENLITIAKKVRRLNVVLINNYLQKINFNEVERSIYFPDDKDGKTYFTFKITF